MSVRRIRFWPDPVLMQRCREVARGEADTLSLIDDLFETMYHAKGRGLAAPQIGVTSRVVVVDVAWKEAQPRPMAFINPVITAQSDQVEIRDEQCLSIPEVPMAVERPKEIELSWTTTDGRTKTGTFSGAEARCILHELDHLNGTVIFDHQPAALRAELEARYAA